MWTKQIRKWNSQKSDSVCAFVESVLKTNDGAKKQAIDSVILIELVFVCFLFLFFY